VGACTLKALSEQNQLNQWGNNLPFDSYAVPSSFSAERGDCNVLSAKIRKQGKVLVSKRCFQQYPVVPQRTPFPLRY